MASVLGIASVASLRLLHGVCVCLLHSQLLWLVLMAAEGDARYVGEALAPCVCVLVAFAVTAVGADGSGMCSVFFISVAHRFWF